MAVKVTFKLVAGSDLTTFENTVNEYLGQGWKFLTGQRLHINFVDGGLQYSVPMVLEEEQ